MPWGSKDAQRHTHKATSARYQKQWSAVANSVLSESGDEGKAVRIANGVVKKHVVPPRKKR